MTSVLNVDTIADKAGSGPVGLTKQSAAKAWCHITAAASLSGSFGISSASDIATGNYSVSFANSFSDAFYAPAGNTSTASFSTNAFTNRTESAGKTTSLYEWSTSNGNSAYDLTFNTLTISGDLA